jgi:hypothetical protein
VFVVSNNNQILRYHPTGAGNPWTNVTPSNGYTWPALHCRGSNVWIAGFLTNNNSGFAKWNGTDFSNIQGSFDLNGVQLVDIWESLDGTLFAADSVGSIHRASPNLANWPIIGNAKGKRISGTTSTDVTTASFSRSAHHFDGMNWSSLTRSDELFAIGITAVPNATPSETLLVGDDGGILVCTATSCELSATNMQAHLAGVWALSPTQAFVVGDAGAILY